MSNLVGMRARTGAGKKVSGTTINADREVGREGGCAARDIWLPLSLPL